MRRELQTADVKSALRSLEEEMCGTEAVHF